MRTFQQRGNDLDLPAAPYGVSAGDGVLVGSIFGVAAAAATVGHPLTVATTGVFSMGKAAGQPFGAGSLVYWDDAARAVTGSSAGVLIGVAIAPADAGSAAALVRLNGAFGSAPSAPGGRLLLRDGSFLTLRDGSRLALR